MKKKYLLLVGLMTLCLAFAGCGKDKEEPVQEVQVTATPEPTATPTPEPEEELVQMQKTEKEKNAIGNKTATASKAVIVNKTGSEISAIYVRPNTSYMDDSEWGTDLVNGSFTLKTGEQAVYYFDASAKDEGGNAITLYDIRIQYTDSSKSECYFRKLPLNTISQISLCMEGTGSGSIPYARYLKTGSTTEYSTLEEVKERIGYYDTDDEEEEEYSAPTATPTPEPDEISQQIDENIGSAESCIGSSVEVLFGTIGEPQGSDYVDEPESGETGYHYYDSFTVYTTVDENGNEIVAGVW